MKRLSYLLLAALLILILPSCATIFAGSRSPVHVTGTPDSAKVYYNGAFVGYAPTKIKVPRGKHDDNVIEIKKENYKPQQIKLTSRFSIGYLILDMVSGYGQ